MSTFEVDSVVDDGQWFGASNVAFIPPKALTKSLQHNKFYLVFDDFFY